MPYFRIKNLSPDYLDNTSLDYFETQMRLRGENSIGSPMVYEMVDLLKEKITSMNDDVLARLDKLVSDEKEATEQSIKGHTSNIQNLTYTPVTKETFAIWCDNYKMRMAEEKARNRKFNEEKPTGKEIFLEKQNDFEDLTLYEEDGEVEDIDYSLRKETAAIGEKYNSDEEGEEFKIDRSLYTAEGLDEDVDFD